VTKVFSGRVARRAAWTAALAGIAAPVVAQQVAPAPQTTPTPTLQAVPVPPFVPNPPVVLPVLTAAQAAELAPILNEAGFAQGLRRVGDPAPGFKDSETLVRAALDYARAVHSGRLAESDFDPNWGLRPAAYDPLPAFAEAVKQNRVGAWLRDLPPPWAGYDTLQKGLATYRKIVAAGGWQKLAAGPDLAVGASGARVAALRKRLAVEDPQAIATGDKFDAELKDAVVRAQRRYGLNPTGVVSSGTLTALNVPAQDRVGQIMANMERWRWLPSELPAKRMQVNIAAAGHPVV